MLNVAVRAARAAGAIINRAALDVEAVRVAQKQINDFVTEVDQASEESIIETLLTAYPGHGILAEESGRVHGNANSEHVWIIDPLDGTTNFIHGFPVYCVSIALQVAGRLEQAVIYDPTRNDLFTATRGRGAFLNDRRLRVSKRTHLPHCLLATGFPFRPGDDFPAYLKMMGELMPLTAGLRRPGAAALDLAYVAAGFSDGFFESGLKPWDMAAGALLVTEAGGLVGNFAGEALQLDVPECLAANPRVYAQMVKVLGKYSRAPVPEHAPKHTPKHESEHAPHAAAADESEPSLPAWNPVSLDSPEEPAGSAKTEAQPVATPPSTGVTPPEDADGPALASEDIDAAADPARQAAPPEDSADTTAASAASTAPPSSDTPAPATPVQAEAPDQTASSGDDGAPRQRLRAAPRRAPPQDEPGERPRYRAAQSAPGGKPVRQGKPPAAGRERAYGRSAGQSPDEYKRYARPAPGGRAPFKNRQDRPAPARSPDGSGGGARRFDDRRLDERRFDDRRSDDRRSDDRRFDDRRGSRPARDFGAPRRGEDAPRGGKPYAPAYAPRDPNRSARPAPRPTSRPYGPRPASGGSARGAPRGKPYTPRGNNR
jgi:myo-inositol-1(or 4)-monophosphatase